MRRGAHAWAWPRRALLCRADRAGRRRAVDDGPAAGPARGRGGHARLLDRLRGRRFYANGWHITGEMGGIWAPPLKLADGLWFGVDGQWVGPATKFTSGQGYVRYDLPPLTACSCGAPTSSPTARAPRCSGSTLSNPAARAKTVTVKVDAHSELLPPTRGASARRPEAADNRPDTAAFDGGALRVHRRRRAAGAPRSRARRPTPRRRRRVGPASAARSRARSARTDEHVAAERAATTARSARAPAASCATACTRRRAARADRLGRGRRLRPGLADARASCRALRDPDAQLAAKVAARDALAARSGVDLPGDRQLQEAVDWGKQNLADLTQTATNLKIRFVDQGKAYPPPVGTVASARRSSAPATPTTRGCSPPTASTRRSRRSRSASSRRSRTHLSALRDGLRRAQRPLGQGRARDRHRRLGLLRRQHRRPATPTSRPSSRARSRSSGAGPATTASATSSTTSPTRNLRYVVSKPRRRQGRLARGPRQRRAHRAWARRSSTTPST